MEHIMLIITNSVLLFIQIRLFTTYADLLIMLYPDDDDDNLFMDRSIRTLKGNFWAIWK